MPGSSVWKINIHGRSEGMTNADLFKATFGMYSTELWAMNEREFLDWMNTEVSEPIRVDKPTDDAVQVVRCRECKYVSRERSPESARKFGQLYDCGLGVLASPKADDFCCYGERREEVD